MSEEQKEDGAGVGGITASTLEAMISDPSHALTQKLAAYINSNMIVQSLPPKVRRRIRALKNLQLGTTRLESEFYKDVQALEAKYQALYQPFFDQRMFVVTGEHEPTDAEAKWEAEEEEEADSAEGAKVNGDGDGDGATASAVDEVRGIPEFWLTALRNAELFEAIIKEHDVPALEHMTDLRVVYVDHSGTDFKIEFHFSENEFFTNKVLTKSYSVTCTLNDLEPLSYDGATISATRGCKIDWKKGKNLTIKVIKKKQKHKGKGAGGPSRVITKTVPNESFFNFFCPPDSDSKGASSDEDVSQTLADDFVRAEFIRDRLVPKAVLFYTGEAIEDDEYDEDDEDEDEEDDEDRDDDYDPQLDVQTNKPPECQQQ